MTKENNELWQDFISVDTSDITKLDSDKLGILVNKLAKINKDTLIAKINQFIINKQYHKNNDHKLIYLLQLIEKVLDKNIVKSLITLFNDEASKFCREDICHTISKIDSLETRDFLKLNLKDDKIGYRCAIGLGLLGDFNAENKLIELLEKSFEHSNAHEEAINALFKINSKKLWSIIDEYLNKDISEKERYKIYNQIKHCKQKEVIPFLIYFYNHYSANNIDFEELKEINIQIGYVFTRAFKKADSIQDKILTEIKDKIKEFSHYKDAKNFLSNLPK